MSQIVDEVNKVVIPGLIGNPVSFVLKGLNIIISNQLSVYVNNYLFLVKFTFWQIRPLRRKVTKEPA